MKVCINPTYNSTDLTEGGIRRVVDAMVKYLPEFGITTTAYPDGADLIVNHGTYNDRRYGVPTVAACHGLYWSGYNWPVWGAEANRAVIDNMIVADAITVPSRWVAQAVTRGLWRPVHTIYHGIEPDEWVPAVEHKGYALWNKARTDPVSDHRDLDQLSEIMPEVAFVSTFGEQRVNTRIIGPQSYDQMRKLVMHAGVYIQTARETGAIGAIEALASGVPVAGWRFGAQEEIIVDGETGYLAEYGDYDELSRCVRRCLDDRRRLSANARRDVQERWGWKDKVETYATLFQDVIRARTSARRRISVVVTCHNLGKYITHTLESMTHQSLELAAWECIIVDDSSTDNSLEVATQVVEYLKGRGPYAFKVVRTPHNLGLSGARNYGASLAAGQYLLFLDADDMLAGNALAAMADFLDHHAEFDIAYGHLDTVAEDGNQRARNPWPDGTFNYMAQMAHLNQFSYAALMRRRVWQNLGGYRTRDWRAEDAGFWCRATSFGYHAACATQESTLIYRIRPDSKSGVERAAHADVDGDWTAWFPWRLGASSGALGADLLAQTSKPELNIKQVPAGAQGTPSRKARSWDVRHHQEPAVSIIIPVGPNHTQYIVDALDSVMAQTCPSWEAVVVYDNSKPLPVDMYPWARFMYSSGGIIPPYEPLGAGAARNVGIRAARAPLVLFLDGDDVLRPEALERLLSVYATQGGYVYSDTLAVLEDARIADVATQDWKALPVLQRGDRVERPAIIPAATWDQKEFLQSGYDGRPGCHSVTALIATADALGVGGFDEKMKALEDWEFYMRVAASGITGHLVAEPLLIYRLSTGTRREDRKGAQSDLEAVIRARYAPFITGEKPMCSCGSGGGGKGAQVRAVAALSDMVPADLEQYMPDTPNMEAYIKAGSPIRLKYVGDHYGAITYRGKVTHTPYRAGREPGAEAVDVDPRDVEGLMLSGAFQVVQL